MSSPSPNKLVRTRSYRSTKKSPRNLSEVIPKQKLIRLKSEAVAFDESPKDAQVNPGIYNEAYLSDFLEVSATEIKVVPVENKQVKRWSLVTKDRLSKMIDLNKLDDEEIVIKILNIEPHQRYEEEVTFLQRALKDLEFYQNLESQVDKDSLRKLIQKLRLEFHPSGERVSYIDAPETNFYVILTGSVDLLLNSDVPKTHRRKNRISLSEKKQIEENSNSLNPASSSRKECLSSLRSTKELGKGDSFGALSINKVENKKNAPIFLCRQDTSLAVLRYSDYYSILAEVYANRYAESINFLLKIDIFQHWYQNRVAALLYSLEEKKYPRNQVIFKEGDKSGRIYFIKEGEVEVYSVPLL